MKITPQNYQSAMQQVNINDLPELFQKSHQMASKSLPDMYEKNETIKRVVDAYISKLNEYLSKQKSQPETTPAPKAEAKPKAKEPAKADPKAEAKQEDKVTGKVFNVNYNVGKVKYLVNYHNGLKTHKDGSKFYDMATFKNKKEFEKFQEDLKAKGYVYESPFNQPKPTPKPTPPASDPVSEVDLEVRFIKRYINLDGKKKTKAQLLTFINSLQRAIERKQIRKTSKYATEIMHIQKELIKIYNDTEVGNSFTFEFDKKDETMLGKFRAIASSQKQRVSVALISRYIGIHGKTAVKEKATTLYKAIKNAFSKKQVTSSDPYYKELKNIEDNLKTFVDQRKEVLKIDAVTLKGLQGIPGVGLIAYNHNLKPGDQVRTCNGSTGIVDKVNSETITLKNHPGRAINKKFVSKIGEGARRQGSGNHMRNLKGLGEVINSTDLENMTYKTYGFDGKWKQLIGDPADPFTLMFWSKPGKGKSTLAIQLVHYMADTFNKKVLFDAVEEGLAYTTQEKFTRLNATHPNIAISASLPADLSPFDVVAIDSVTRAHMTPDEFVALRNRYPGKTFILIFQATVDGNYRGNKEWEHEVDVSININENGYARAEKTRFGGTGPLKVFEGTVDQIYKFTLLQDAEKFVANRSNEKLYTVQGDDGKIWVTNRDKANELKNQGYGSY